MKKRCNPPRLDEHDWSQFDFTRWNLDRVAPDAVAKAIAGLAQQFFDSPEWQEHVQASLPQLRQAALATFKGHAEKLRADRAAAERDFEQRTAHAKQISEAMRRAMAASAAPQAPQPRSDAYHVAVRVTGADPLLGLPGMVVQIADPRDAKAPPLASATTDVDGNATLTVGPGLARELDKRDTAVSVLSPSGKELARVADGVCVRLNQVETKVIPVKESGETAPQKQAALDTRASHEALLKSLEGRAQTLETGKKERLADFDCKLQDADAIVAELEQPPDLAQVFERAKPSSRAQAAAAAKAAAAPPAGAPPQAPAAGTTPPSPARPSAPPSPTVAAARPAPRKPRRGSTRGAKRRSRK